MASGSSESIVQCLSHAEKFALPGFLSASTQGVGVLDAGNCS